MDERIQVLMQSRRGITEVRNTLVGMINQLTSYGYTYQTRVYRDPEGKSLERIGRYVFEERERPLMNIPEVRNFMIEESSIDTCLLLDDDVIFESNCLSLLVEAFKEQRKHVVPWCRNILIGSVFSRYKNMGVDLVSRNWILNYAPFYGSAKGWMHSYYIEHWFDVLQVNNAVMRNQRVHSLVTEGYQKVS